MRVRLLSIAIGIAIGVGIGVANAQAPSSTSEARATSGAAKPVTITDDLRRHVVAVNFQDNGRILRPNSWDELDADQKTLVDDLLNSPRGELKNINSNAPHPFGMFLASPVMGDLFQKAQGYARFTTGSTRKLNEFAIVIVARTWKSNYIWRAHRNSAIAAGIRPDIIEAIRQGNRPANMPPDVEAIYNFCTEFLATKHVSDATLAAAKTAAGGDKAILDLTASMGYYQLNSMFHNLDHVPLPKGVDPKELIPDAPVFQQQ